MKKLLNLYQTLCLIAALTFSYANESLEKNDPMEITSQSLETHEKSFEELKKSKDPMERFLCGEICFLKLDGKVHPLKEAAFYYLMAAHGEHKKDEGHKKHEDIYNYITHAVPGIFEQDKRKQIELLVHYWVLDATQTMIEPLSPAEVNNYLIFQHKQYINKTMAQKLPYFFEKCLVALLYLKEFSIATQDQENSNLEEKAPTSKPLPKVSSQPFRIRPLPKVNYNSLIKEQSVAAAAGNLYPQYHKTIDPSKKLEKGAPIPSPKASPKINVLLQHVLNAFHEHTRSFNAKNLSRLSHMEYPWLIEALKNWEIKNPSAQILSSLSNQEFKEKLGKMEVVDQSLLEDAADKIEAYVNENHDNKTKKLFANTKEAKGNAYSQNMKIFFFTDISRENDLVQKVLESFINKTKSLNLDLNNKEEIKSLDFPIIIFYCEDINLKNIQNKGTHATGLENLVRYYFHLKSISFHYGKDFYKPQSAEKSDYNRRIVEVRDTFKERGFAIKDVSE